MVVSLNGFNNLVATFNANIGTKQGCVIMSGQTTVKNPTGNDDFIGICTTVNADKETAGVLMQGYVEMPYKGTTPTVGYKNLVSSGADAVEVKDTPVASKKRLITMVDTVNKTVGFIL